MSSFSISTTDPKIMNKSKDKETSSRRSPIQKETSSRRSPVQKATSNPRSQHSENAKPLPAEYADEVRKMIDAAIEKNNDSQLSKSVSAYSKSKARTHSETAESDRPDNDEFNDDFRRNSD